MFVFIVRHGVAGLRSTTKLSAVAKCRVELKLFSPRSLSRFAAVKLCMCRDERGDQLANGVERVNICRLIPQHCSLVEFNFTNATLLSVFISHTREEQIL